MSSIRPLGMLLAVLLLGACGGSSASEPLALPALEALETTEGAPLEVSFTATGGSAPLRYSLQGLPPGCIFLTDTGVLQGPVKTRGSYPFTVFVKDAAGTEVSRAYSLRALEPPALVTSTLSAATVGQAYSQQLTASGGAAPWSFSLTGGLLPAGLTLSEDGLLQGTPREAGSFGPRVRVQDAHGARAERVLGLEVRTGSSTGDGGLDGGVDGSVPADFVAANWNLEWFGSPDAGPSNEPLQLNNVSQVMATTGADFWGLQELVDATQFDALKKKLPGYDGFMANDPGVPSGSYYYAAGEQKVGVLFRSSTVTVLDKRLMPLTSAEVYAFGSRPPLQVRLRVTRDGQSTELVVLVLHMKAYTDMDSYNRRQNAAVALKSYLDSKFPTTPVLVLGDWNDDVDTSITQNQPSPYQAFVDDAADYTFLTQPLSLRHVRSTVSNSEFIDHQLVNHPLLPSYVSNSTQVLRPDLSYISDYKNTTTDHYPVLSRFHLP